jgi:TolA-binding protein
MCFRRDNQSGREISGLRFGVLRERLQAFMQSQEAANDFFFNLWPWFEANAKRLAYGVVVALIAIFVFSFYTYRQNKKEVDAGEALTQAGMSNTGSPLAAACLKIAADYSGTAAGQRALLQGATALFAVDRFPDAQVQFQKFLDTYPDSSLTAQAALGVAASLDAQGMTDAAIGAYQKTINQTSDPSVVATAKFALARIDEAQGKSADADKIYAEITRAYPNTSMASEAGMRDAELKTKSPAAAPATPIPAATAPAIATPFNLSH